MSSNASAEAEGDSRSISRDTGVQKHQRVFTKERGTVVNVLVHLARFTIGLAPFSGPPRASKSACYALPSISFGASATIR
jgi:hypothetical protein